MFERISVCVDVEFTGPSLRALDSEFKIKEDFFLGASSKADPEVAVSAQIAAARDSTLHVTIEFRKSMVAPFPKLTPAKMARLMERLRAGKSYRLRHAEVTYMPGGLELSALPPLEHRNVRITGFTYEVVRESAEEPQQGSRVRFLEKGVVEVTNWLRTDRPVASIFEALQVGVTESLKQGAAK